LLEPEHFSVEVTHRIDLAIKRITRAIFIEGICIVGNRRIFVGHLANKEPPHFCQIWLLLKDHRRPADSLRLESDTNLDAVGDFDEGMPLFIELDRTSAGVIAETGTSCVGLTDGISADTSMKMTASRMAAVSAFPASLSIESTDGRLRRTRSSRQPSSRNRE
jgi:hypothetical protein